jgi:HNH endonuclease
MRTRRHYQNRNTVLALDASFRPMAEISRRKAIKAIVTRKADIIINHQTFETASWVEAGQPIKMIIYRHTKKAPGEPRLHSGNKGLQAIIRRDGHKCCYCNVNLKGKNATVDHILPRSKGGLTAWSNLVGCCFTCNQKKGNRLLEDSGMSLLRKPTTPTMILMERFHKLVNFDPYETANSIILTA